MRLILICAIWATTALLTACGNGDGQNAKPAAAAQTPEQTYVETGDLAALHARGNLRILMPRLPPERLPRSGYPLDMEQQLAERFAHQQGLKPVLVYAPFPELIPLLKAGKGDVIAANLTMTDQRRKELAFTVPIGHVHEQLVLGPHGKPPRRLSDLRGKTLSVLPGTTYAQTARKLAKRVSGLRVEQVPAATDIDDLLDQVAASKIAYTILDNNLLDEAMGYHQGIRPGLQLSKEQPLAWGIRQDNPELRKALDRFLTHEQLTRPTQPTYTVDLDGIRKRKVLRVITRNSGATYFLWRGELMGFDYELARRFAKSLGVRLEMVVAPSRDRLIPMLREGKGDMIAAFLTPTKDRERQGVVFTRPYHYASEVVVAPSGAKDLDSPADLAGKTLVVRRTSSYWQTLEKLRREGIGLHIRLAPEDMETEAIIARVASGKYPLTVADSQILELEMAWRDDIKGVLNLTKPQPQAWAMRSGDRKLLAAANRFLKKEYRGLFYNVTYNKYFRNTRLIRTRQAERPALNPQGELSPYDKLVKRYAGEYHFDWRLIVSQMYQESRFDPDTRSWAGARGLMQVLPRTARELGVDHLEKPANGIRAGVMYLDWLRDRFEPDLPVKDRMWFTLAAYNAGAGHVRDARRLAARKGWNPDRWFGNVERAMLLLSKRKYANQARHGYVRGREPVNYVRQIRDRYQAYLRLLEQRPAQQALRAMPTSAWRASAAEWTGASNAIR
ncbi:MAG: membrane-bound lytic murein transglycosylase MltF [Gammaproteobacteria bacterium]|jgi:membrane-bound lytic murein transglycosylase F